MQRLIVAKSSEKHSAGTLSALKVHLNAHQREAADTEPPLVAPCQLGTCHRGLAFPTSSVQSIIKSLIHSCLWVSIQVRSSRTTGQIHVEGHVTQLTTMAYSTALE